MWHRVDARDVCWRLADEHGNMLYISFLTTIKSRDPDTMCISITDNRKKGQSLCMSRDAAIEMLSLCGHSLGMPQSNCHTPWWISLLIWGAGLVIGLAFSILQYCKI